MRYIICQVITFILILAVAVLIGIGIGRMTYSNAANSNHTAKIECPVCGTFIFEEEEN